MEDAQLLQDFYEKGRTVHYCPLSIVRGFPIDWNPGSRDPFVMSPQYLDILKKVAESRKAYRKRGNK